MLEDAEPPTKLGLSVVARFKILHPNLSLIADQKARKFAVWHPPKAAVQSSKGRSADGVKEGGEGMKCQFSQGVTGPM